jgi:hypothetical protein
MLRFLGLLTLVATGLILVYLASLLVASLPDIRRYLKIRSM